MNLNINSNNINLLKYNTQKRISEANNLNKSLKNNTDDKKNSLNINIRKQNSDKNNILEKLEKQKQALIEAKHALSTLNMDPKEKKYKIKQLNENIENIEYEIQQFKLNEKQEEIQKKQEEMLKKQAKEQELKPDEDEVRDDVIISASLNELIKFNHSAHNIHRLKDSKNRQLVEKNYIKHLTNLDGYSDPNNYNDKRLLQIMKSVSCLEQSTSKEITKINNAIKRIHYKTKIEAKKSNSNENINDKKNNHSINTNEKDNLKNNIIEILDNSTLQNK